MSDEFAPFIQQLEDLGEEQVRSKLSMGQWAERRKKWAHDWLEHRSSDRRDAREEETLSIARKALSTSERATESSERANEIAEEALASAKRSNKIAISAIIFASAIPIIAAVIQVMF